MGFVVIGRNEGERLKNCLRSVIGDGPVVYVDSGSDDRSQDFARSLGVEVVQLSVPPNFTAARARNAGVDRLKVTHPTVEYIQMVDGDCEVRPGWIAVASSTLAETSDLAIVFGRTRERYPDRSIYNALCDHEWAAPIGDAAGCGGNAMIRLGALSAVGGYDSAQIAGEDSEMSIRIRKMGWRIACIDYEMVWHDAEMLRFRQWWKRSKRAGYAFAEMAHKHPDARWPNWPRTCRSIVAWGAGLPAMILLSLMFAVATSCWWTVAAAIMLALYPYKMMRVGAAKRAAGLRPTVARNIGILLILGKFPEFTGLVLFYRDRLVGRRSQIIEYRAV